MSKFERSVLKAIEENNFLELIYHEYLNNFNQREKLSNILAHMHNSGKLDIVAEYKKLRRSVVEQKFFTMRHVLSDTLPLLKAPSKDIWICIKHIIKEAETDLSAFWIEDAFTRFCKASPERPVEMIDLEIENFDSNAQLLSSSLYAGSTLDLSRYLNKALNLFLNQTIEIVQAAIFAIGRMDFGGNVELITKAFDSIQAKCLSNISSDTLLATSLMTLNKLTQLEPSLSSQLIEFINMSASSDNILFVHATTEILSRDHTLLSQDIKSVLLEVAKLVKAENNKSISNLDFYFSDCSKDDFLTVVDTMEFIFINTKFAISINNFKNLRNALVQSPYQNLEFLITHWFLKRDISYGKMCLDCFSEEDDRNIELRFDSSLLNQKNIHLYLAKKACGWLFTKPITATSLIISLIETSSNEELGELANIIFNPLLISYSGGVKDYLLRLKDSNTPKVISFCDELLSRLVIYHEGLSEALKLKELKPSVEHRELYNRLHDQQMNDLMVKARERSFFASLFHESVLLYGRKSINYMYRGDHRTRQETPLHTISHSIEFPSMSHLDPHSLDEILLVFRLEGCINETHY